MVKFIKREKQLLLTDIIARLPYGIKVFYNGINCVIENIGRDGSISLISDDSTYKKAIYLTSIEYIKPYFHPMSSMTEEEKEELRQEQIKDEQLFVDCIKNHPEMRGLIIPHFAADWCDKNMFDYRGLIPMGLALKAPEGMYNN